jgi:dipeptidyl aminopeptidase/acylaminoacyl peptidase
MPRFRLLAAVAICAGVVVVQTGLAARSQGAATPPNTPTIDQLISLKRVGSPAISPNGQWIAYTVREANWDENDYHTEIWLADAKTGETRQLTRHAKKSSTSPAWSPDGEMLAFATDRDDKRQIYAISPRGGEARKLTAAEEGVGSFAWAPDGKSLAFTATDAKTDADKAREKQFGDFTVFGEDYRMSHLWIFDLATGKARRLTSGAFTVGQFAWAPDGRKIAFDHRVNPANASSGTADISLVSVADGAVTPLVTQNGSDSSPAWSPDGSKVAFESARTRAESFLNTSIGVIPSAGGPIDYISTAFDEDPAIIRWTVSGIFFAASERTSAFLYSIDPATRAVKKYAPGQQPIGSGFSVTPDGQTVAFVASSASTLPEIYVAPVAATMTPRKLTDMTAQTAAWPKSALEIVSWKSQDGATIEGVLHKPIGFTAGRKYPLLVVIHGGPTGVSRPAAFSSTSIYPIDIWTAKGALVLEPNYRGSAGYGEKFRSLNVRNLGIGDAWDVLSGIDRLVADGLVDRDRVGAMGWSQGGYISAFLTTKHSDRFKAISVGAGISNWMTYYVNTDIHPFTRQYLKATPWDDPKIYAETSPMTYIKSAKTPTLIQHGDADQRVPPPNAFELYQGLRDQNVPTELVLFKGFGHPLTKPKANRAAMQQNLDWFTKYLWPNSTTSR